MRCLHRDAARTHAARYRRRHRHGRGPARAAFRPRLAFGCGMPNLGRRFVLRHGHHDERQGRRVYEGLHGRAGQDEQDRHRIRTRHPRGQGLPADGLLL